MTEGIKHNESEEDESQYLWLAGLSWISTPSPLPSNSIKSSETGQNTEYAKLEETKAPLRVKHQRVIMSFLYVALLAPFPYYLTKNILLHTQGRTLNSLDVWTSVALSALAFILFAKDWKTARPVLLSFSVTMLFAHFWTSFLHLSSGFWLGYADLHEIAGDIYAGTAALLIPVYLLAFLILHLFKVHRPKHA